MKTFTGIICLILVAQNVLTHLIMLTKSSFKKLKQIWKRRKAKWSRRQREQVIPLDVSKLDNHHKEAVEVFAKRKFRKVRPE